MTTDERLKLKNELKILFSSNQTLTKKQCDKAWKIYIKLFPNVKKWSDSLKEKLQNEKEDLS